MSKHGNYVLSQDDLLDVVELTRGLARIPTESPEGEFNAEFVDYVESELKRRIPAIATEKVTIPSEAYDDHPEQRAAAKGEKIILIGRISAPGRPKLHVNDHYDVARAGDPTRWTVTGPFEPRVVEDKLFGRGVCDPKGSIASCIKALEIVHREGLGLEYDITLSLSPDEECGGYTGLTHLVNLTLQGVPYIDAEAFFSLDGAQNYVSIGKTGLLGFEVVIAGQAAHSSRSSTGINAIELAVPVLAELLALKLEVEQRVSRWPVNPELSMRYVRPDLVITMINGGFSKGAVPDCCVISGSRTVIPDESERPVIDATNELIGTLLTVRQKYQIPMQFHVEPLLPPFITDGDSPFVQRLADAAARGSRKRYPVACSEGCNDISRVSALLGIPTFGRGVQREGCQVHAYDENVPLDNLRIGVEDLVTFFRARD